MWLTIIDFREQVTTAKEVVEDDNIDWDEYVHNLVGHIDHYYMSTPGLEIQINEINNPNQQIITKAPRKNDFELLKEYLRMDIEAGNFDINQNEVADEEYKRILKLK